MTDGSARDPTGIEDDDVDPRRDLRSLLRAMNPVLHEGVYTYSTVPRDAPFDATRAIFLFRESESVTVILPEEEALRIGVAVLFRAAWITLEVHSDLNAVGFTAEFSRALAERGIGCNVVAAANHDHVFVPVESAEQALAALRRLQEHA